MPLDLNLTLHLGLIFLPESVFRKLKIHYIAWQNLLACMLQVSCRCWKL